MVPELIVTIEGDIASPILPNKCTALRGGASGGVGDCQKGEYYTQDITYATCSFSSVFVASEGIAG
jgi:hypothetical protein